MKHLLAIEPMELGEIERILEAADAMLEISQREIKRVPTLRGRTVINLFLEPSTRTRVSFEIAAKRLSADAINVSASGSSLSKAETLNDMAQNLAAMNADLLVVRDSTAGVPAMLASRVRIPVVNAGDGAHEHPTQALLDAFTVRQSLGGVEGRIVSIIGDIAHSRVARSDIHVFRKLGAEVRIAGPPTMMPIGVEELGVKPCSTLEEALDGAHVICVLRIQRERLEGAPGRAEHSSRRTFSRWARRPRRNSATSSSTSNSASAISPSLVGRDAPTAASTLPDATRFRFWTVSGSKERTTSAAASTA